MRILNKDVDPRLVVKLNRVIAPGSIGIMQFGEKNDYPNVIEKLVQSSVTATSVADIYARFLTGLGFNNEALNNVVVSKDIRQKDITVLDMLRSAASSVSRFNGVYVKVRPTGEGKIKLPEILPFKNCRFHKVDDSGYISKIAYYDNWPKDKAGEQFKKEDIKSYFLFNPDPKAISAQVQAVKGTGPQHHPGQVYFQFFDNSYLYPLSPFDSVYLDADSEWQLSIYQNREVRNGFMLRHIVRVAEPESEEDADKLREKVTGFQGADGARILLMTDEIDPETGEVKDTGAFKIEKVDSNINDKLFDSYHAELTNRIRKANKALPAVLIDYEESSLGTTSGEGIVQAVNFYNSMTADDRSHMSRMFMEIFKHSDIPELANNEDWSIKPLQLLTLSSNG